MKKILAACCILISLHIQAQTSWSTSGNAGTTPGTHFLGTTDNQSLMFKTNGTQRMLIDPLGNIQLNGVDTYLKMNDRFTLQPIYTSANNWTRGILSSNIRWNNTTNMWKVEGAPYDDFTMIRFENNGKIGFYTREITGSAYEISDAGLSSYQRMFINDIGQVGINTNDTKGYQFAVNGSSIFTSVKVKLYGNWPDYVFKRDYELLSLSELEKFIQKNSHLPGIPSATDVEKNGLDLGVNQAALLKKIEELTLYIIEQKKEIDEMKVAINDLKNKK